MALYTMVAWTAIVIVGGAYYWIYIRQAPFPIHLLRIASTSYSGDSAVEGTSVVSSSSSSSSQKRKRKTGSSKRRPAASQKNEPFTRTSGINSAETNNGAKSTQQIQDERKGLAENKNLKSYSSLIPISDL